MDEQERIDRFESAFNRIDKGLDELIRDKGRSRRTFSSRVRIASHEQRRLGRFKDFLLEISELRNAMIHNRTGDDMYLAVPSQRTVEQLEFIEDRVLSPTHVIPTFARKVEILRPDQTLHDAWGLVRDEGYSRYPVYDKNGFTGLLTPNGFTRWCAAQLKDGVLHIDTNTVRLDEVLATDHRRDQVAFLHRNALIDDADQLFSDREPLEAILITEHGKKTERPLGMICPGDLVGRE